MPSFFHKDRVRAGNAMRFATILFFASVLSACIESTYAQSHGHVMAVTHKSAQVHSNRRGGAAKCAPLTALIFLIIALLVRFAKNIFSVICRFTPGNALTKSNLP